MTSEKSVSKSQIRKILHAQYSKTFTHNETPTALVFEDAIQMIKCVSGTSDMCRTVDEFMNAIVGNANHMLDTRPRMRVYSMVFDKYPYVPLGKGVEQAKRNAKARVDELTASQVPPAETYSHARPYLKSGAPLPADWARAVLDRDVGMPAIISSTVRLLVLSAAAGRNGTYNFTLRAGRRVCIDGHYLKLADVMELACIYPNRKTAERSCGEVSDTKTYLSNKALWRSFQLDNDFAIMETPLVFELITDVYGEVHVVVYFETRLRNRVGETDFSMFTLHRLWCRILHDEAIDSAAVGMFDTSTHEAAPLLNADFLSIDVDIICLALLYLDRIKRRMLSSLPLLNVRYAPRLSWAFSKYTTHNRKADERWVDCRALYEAIESGKFDVPLYQPPASGGDGKNDEYAMGRTLLKFVSESAHERVSQTFASKIQEPVWSVVTSLVIGGSDYTAGYYGVTHDRCFTALKMHSGYVGNLAVFTKPSGSASDSWSDALSPYDKSAGIGLFFAHGAGYARLVQTAFMLGREQFREADPAKTSWKTICDATQTLAPKNRPPPMPQILAHLNHLNYYLMLVSQLGDRCLIEPNNLTDYGFRKLDGRKAWSRSNIARVTAEDLNQTQRSASVPIASASLDRSNPETVRQTAALLDDEDDDEDDDVNNNSGDTEKRQQ